MAENEQPKAPADKATAWHTQDLDFDRNGRVVIKNPALARAIAKSIGSGGGLVFHFPHPDVHAVKPGDVPPPTPLWRCMVPNRMCPDSICGVDVFLVAHRAPGSDPAHDGSEKA